MRGYMLHFNSPWSRCPGAVLESAAEEQRGSCPGAEQLQAAGSTEKAGAEEAPVQRDLCQAMKQKYDSKEKIQKNISFQSLILIRNSFTNN